MLSITNPTAIQALNASPMMIAEAVKKSPVLITNDSKSLFYCVDQAVFADFLAWQKERDLAQNKPDGAKKKKRIGDFAGALRTKTDVRLTIQELNLAITQSAEQGSKQGL
ncbi:hypothetical protein B0181_01890 [Moraxella caviae]|uniref:Uncharacterized protein n=1 Tax=Moraxella caviae TaxID=34060 RepID=A0A1T0A9P3_9GAMM|nr:hypothetical protein [Moraxella caviae]OOR92359.1 hypothetical protein B0181_01890 [Moraxella caviae]STZ10571.1 Uncharacterised protein [Moraxella caviae]